MVFFSRGRLAHGLCLAVASLTMAAASGCGPSKASITGTVTYSGQPLPSGTITFASEAGAKPVKAAPITDGKYTITDFIAGPAKVTILTTPPPSSGGRAPPGAPVIAAPTTAAPGKYVPIPAKYNNPEQSGLSYDVKSGANTKDFPLTP
jgi:hypothetical protein